MSGGSFSAGVGFELLEVFYNLVRRIAGSFDAAGLDYAFTGALAATFYGVPRTTVDLDVLVLISAENVQGRLVSALKRAGLSVEGREVEKALASGYRIATFRDKKSPYSLDIILSGDRFGKRRGRVAGVEMCFQVPEDLVLAKLRMIKATVPRGRALKDEEDIKAILRFTRVNVEEVRRRARVENTLSVFEQVVS